MTDISVSEERRSMPKEPFNASNYVNPIFSMFDGETEHITTVFDAAYLNVVIDHFGENVHLSALEDGCFRADFQAAVSTAFLSWIIGFGGGAFIVSPLWVADEVQRLALEVAEIYTDIEK